MVSDSLEGLEGGETQLHKTPMGMTYTYHSGIWDCKEPACLHLRLKGYFIVKTNQAHSCSPLFLKDCALPHLSL